MALFSAIPSSTARLTVLLPALCLLANPWGAAAGDAIQFSSPRAKSGPTRSSVSAEKTGNGLGNLNSFSPPTSSAGQPQTGRRQDRKSRQAELERKNWMILEPGELQQKEDLDAAFGGGTKQDGKSTADLWFSQKNGASVRKTAPSPTTEEESSKTESARSKIRLTDGLDLKLEDTARYRHDSSGLLGPADAKGDIGRNGGLLPDVFRNNVGSKEAEAANIRSDFGFGARSLNSMSPGAQNSRGESITFGLGSSQRSAPAPAFGSESLARPTGSPNLGVTPDPNVSGSGGFGSSLGNEAARTRAGGLENSGFSIPSSLQAPSTFDSRSLRSTFELPSRPR